MYAIELFIVTVNFHPINKKNGILGKYCTMRFRILVKILPIPNKWRPRQHSNIRLQCSKLSYVMSMVDILFIFFSIFLEFFSVPFSTLVTFLTTVAADVTLFSQASCYLSITKKNLSIGVTKMMMIDHHAVDETETNILTPIHLPVKPKAKISNVYCKSSDENEFSSNKQTNKKYK